MQIGLQHLDQQVSKSINTGFRSSSLSYNAAKVFLLTTLTTLKERVFRHCAVLFIPRICHFLQGFFFKPLIFSGPSFYGLNSSPCSTQLTRVTSNSTLRSLQSDDRRFTSSHKRSFRAVISVSAASDRTSVSASRIYKATIEFFNKVYYFSTRSPSNLTKSVSTGTVTRSPSRFASLSASTSRPGQHPTTACTLKAL